MNARTRVAQRKPTSGKRRWSIRGIMVPDIDPPVVASPTIAARRRQKKWAMAPIAGVKMREFPTPHRIP
jgi:hypothetical protein